MSYYNADELEPPLWINKEFLQKVLNHHEQKENVEIIQLDLTPASMKGDHYASLMFRCKVEYRFPCLANQATSLIIKTVPEEEGIKRNILVNSTIFETEIDMYTETLPRMEKILAECGEPTKLCAKIIYYAFEPQKVIIFEDLCESGYKAIRGRFLTENEMKQVYSKIAKIHAISYMLGRSENHEVVTKYQEGIFSSSAIMNIGLIKNGLSNFIKMLSNHEEFAVYLEKIKAMQPDINKSCKTLYNAYKLNKDKEDEIYVLNHGDFHMKNMMYKFNNDNQVEDLIMVDYQRCVYAPSNIDMTYTQYMMLRPDLRCRKDEFMQYYFTEFTNILGKIGFQGVIPKYSSFQIADLKYRRFSVFMMSTFLPMVRNVVVATRLGISQLHFNYNYISCNCLVATLEDLKDFDVNDMIEKPDTLAAEYEHPDFLNDMRRYLPLLLSKGYLD